MNKVIIGIGSNIEPELNTHKVMSIFHERFNVICIAPWLKTKPVGFTEQDDFINGAILIETSAEQKELNQILKEIETEMGRVRTANKNGPRIIDLDILTWNGTIIDEDYHTRDFLRILIEAITHQTSELN